jgi:hypothetical protein
MKKLQSGLIAILASLPLGQAASANTFPPNIVANYALFANQTLLTLNITSQGSTGTCQMIEGQITPQPADGTFDPIVGYYCRSTGLISFLRNSGGNGATYQVYTGQISAAPQLSSSVIGGSFASFGGGNANGPYQFFTLGP